MKPRKILKAVLISLGALLVIGVIGTALDEKTATSATLPTEGSTSNPTEAKLVRQNSKSLFISPEYFKVAFNNFCDANHFKLLISDIEVKEGDVNNSFTIKMNESVVLVGSIEKSDGSVKQLIIFGAGNGTHESGIQILTGITAAIGSADASLAPSERGEIVKVLGLLDSKTDFSNHEAKYDRNGFHYWVNCNQYTGVNFGIGKN
jgi:hypothetical protein